MSRPTEWHPLHESDPVPGDPEGVAKLGRELRKMADEIDKQAKNIEALSSVDGWDSDAGRAFHDIADGTSGRLKRSYERYDEASKAVGTKVMEGESKEYASELHRAQKVADKALRDFREAEADRDSALQGLEKYKNPVSSDGKPPTQEAITDRNRLDKNLEHSWDIIRHCHSEIRRAIDIRDDAASAAAKRIKNIIHHDGVRDPGGFMNLLADWADGLSNLSAVFSVLAVICAFVPPLQFLVPIFAGLAVLTSALALAGHAYDMTVRGAKLDVFRLILDGVGIVPGMGALKGIRAAKGLKGLSKLRGLKFSGMGAAKGVGEKFMNGIAVKATNGILMKYGPKNFVPIAGRNITGLIKGTGLASAINKVAHGGIGSSTGDPGDTKAQPPAPPAPTVTRIPSPPLPVKPSSLPFHNALTT
ncbi:putative T7SS-secreted protein [Streptomyces sp. NPDC088725]|uniref:putative T7SS-secreted protein n=1 Tax=Streptomyces sp. NPDC088725 TaxID=3365873 RepID=UPI0037FF7B9C